MVRLRILFVAALILLLLGVALFTFLNQRLPQTVFAATANRDCAPWDGTAFTVQIPLDRVDVIYISIWRAPNIRFPKAYSFPDETGQVGNVILIHPSGSPDLLMGEVWLQSVREVMPIEGRFKLTSESGVEFVGKFHAEWGNMLMLCG